MKILFILEPSIELGNPEFRFPTLRNSLIPQIKALDSSGAQTHLIIGEGVASRVMRDGYVQDLHSVSVIDHFKWTNGENSLERSLRHQSKIYEKEEIARLGRIIYENLPENFSPDIIFVWESPMYFLEEIFPSAKVIYQMPGFFSRAPFPELIKFDVGLLDVAHSQFNSSNKKPSLKSELQELRNKDAEFFSSLNLVEPVIKPLKQKFQSLILLPLQIDNYFMVNYLLQRKSQFDVVLDFLHKTPPNIGVLITNYWSGNLRSAVLSNENVHYLRSKFKNFIYIEKLNSIQSVSQLLLPLVDGVFTISSSVGYQAAYWGKPLFSLGESHISKYNTANKFNNFITQVEKKSTFHQDDLITQDILGSNFPVELIKENSQNFYKWIKNYCSLNDSTSQQNFWTSDSHLLKEFTELRREQSYLKHCGFERTTNGNNALTHSSDLSAQIKKHDIISFDIFDTLLHRPFKNPSDLFDFMGDDVSNLIGKLNCNFKDIRRESEKLAFESAIQRGDGETHIDEIYHYFELLTGCSHEDANRVKELEMQFEYDLLYPRKTAKTAFYQALSMGKRVIIISDMYLSQKFLEKILHKNGYHGYEKIFVSSEVKLKKHNGRLFDHVLMDLNASSNSILHIGDNLQADVINPKQRGIKAFHLVKSSNIFQKSDAYKLIWSRDEERHSIDAEILITIAGNLLHDNPFMPSRRGTLFSGDAWRLGVYGFGILLLGYAKWVMDQAIRDKVDRLYFLSRDGLIVKKAYDILAKSNSAAPKSNYLLCSRRAVNLAKIKTEFDIIDLLNVDFSQTTFSHFFKARFGLKEVDIDVSLIKQYGFSLDSRIDAKSRSSLAKILLLHKEKIFKTAKYERDNYLKYLADENFLDYGNIAIVDIGYAGTMQESLFELIDRCKQVNGYYLMTFRQALKRVDKKGLNAKAFLGNFIDRHDTFHPFCKFVPLYETLFSNTETTFLKIEKDWDGILKPVYMDRFPQEEVRENIVARIHSGALDFVSATSSVMGGLIEKIDIEPNKAIRILDHYFSNPHSVDAQIMQGVVFEDSYGGAQLKKILSENHRDHIVWNKGRDSIILNKRLNQDFSTDNSVNLNKERFKSISYKKIIIFILSKFLNEKKVKKLQRSPKLFFEDSKYIMVRFIGKFFFAK